MTRVQVAFNSILVKRWTADQLLIEEASQSPNISFQSVRTPGGYFGRNVVGCSTHVFIYMVVCFASGRDNWVVSLKSAIFF